jgi:hypothetical protein
MKVTERKKVPLTCTHCFGKETERKEKDEMINTSWIKRKEKNQKELNSFSSFDKLIPVSTSSYNWKT